MSRGVIKKRERERERDNFSVNERGLIGPRRESQCYNGLVWFWLI